MVEFCVVSNTDDAGERDVENGDQEKFEQDEQDGPDAAKLDVVEVNHVAVGCRGNGEEAQEGGHNVS